MALPRRRTRTVLPIVVVIAMLTAFFASQIAKRPVPERDAPRGGAMAGHATVTRPSEGAAAPGDAPSAPARIGNPPGFTTRAHLVEHFDKHGEEFPGLDIDGYLRAAQALRDAPVGGSVMEVQRRDGVITRFDNASGAFLAVNRDRTIRTFFKPNDGAAYFARQASRSHGGGR